MFKLLISIVLLGIQLSLFAQMGPEAGWRSSFAYSNLRNLQDKNAAEQIIPTLSHNYGLEFGFTYTMQKSIRSGLFIMNYGKTYIDGNTWIQKRANYTKMPILFKQITDPRESRLMFSYFIGPQLSWLNKGDHYVRFYDDFEDANANHANFEFLDKRPALEKADYSRLYGMALSTSLMYRRFNVDLSFGGGVEYPIKSYLMLSLNLKFDWTILNAELKNKEVFGQKFWTELWGHEGRRRTGSFSVGPTIGLIFVPPKF